MSSDKLSFEDIQAAVAAAKARQRPPEGGLPPRLEPHFGPPSGDVAPEDEPDPEIPPLPPGLASGEPAEDRRDGHRGWPVLRTLQLIVALAAVVGFAALVWWGYSVVTGGAPDAEVPVITAELQPEKVRPENEGGIEVPNQDKLIYDEITPGQEQARVESLLPEPEEPITPPVAGFPGDTLPPEPAPQSVESVPVPPAPETPPGSEPPAALADAPAAVEPPVAETREDAAAALIPPVPPAPPPSFAQSGTPESPAQAAAAGPGVRIQLAAFKSAAVAREAWARLQKRHPDALQGLTLTVQQADLGASGVFYRVQAGPFATRKAAEAVCAQLKQRNQPCLIVSP